MGREALPPASTTAAVTSADPAIALRREVLALLREESEHAAVGAGA